MKVFENVLETIGNTPMIRLHKVCDEIAATVYAKVETYNPGHSIKDRMAMIMIKDGHPASLRRGGDRVPYQCGIIRP